MRTISRDITGAFVFSKDGKLLLGLMGLNSGGAYAGMWVVPGGGIENDESPEQALLREFKEETSLDLANHELKFVDSIDKDEREKTLRYSGERVIVKMHFNNFESHLGTDSRDVSLQPNDEFEKLDWFDLSKLPKNIGPVTRTVLKRWGYIGE
jgi:8-oxo-dGTP pyrophosphatase MutT (NUDIX family)